MVCKDYVFVKFFRVGNSIFRSFRSLKKIDRDCIDLSIAKNNRFNREKKVFFVCFLTVFPPFYAKRSNRSRPSSIFFKDRHYRFPLVDLSICRSQKGLIRLKNRLSYSQHWNFQKAMYHLRLSLGWMGRTFLRLSKALACSKVRSWTEHYSQTINIFLSTRFPSQIIALATNFVQLHTAKNNKINIRSLLTVREREKINECLY